MWYIVKGPGLVHNNLGKDSQYFTRLRFRKLILWWSWKSNKWIKLDSWCKQALNVKDWNFTRKNRLNRKTWSENRLFLQMRLIWYTKQNGARQWVKFVQRHWHDMTLRQEWEYCESYSLVGFCKVHRINNPVDFATRVSRPCQISGQNIQLTYNVTSTNERVTTDRVGQLM